MEERIIRLERLVAEQQKEIEALKLIVSAQKANGIVEKRKKKEKLAQPLPLPLPGSATSRDQREEEVVSGSSSSSSSSSHRTIVSTNKRNNALEKATRFIRSLPASISIESQCKLFLMDPLLATRAAAAAAAEPFIPITTKTVFQGGSLRIVPSVAFRGSAKKIRAIKKARMYDEYVAKARSKTLRISPSIVPSLATWKQSASIAAPSSSSSNKGQKKTTSAASVSKDQTKSSTGTGITTLTPSTRPTSSMNTGGTSSSSSRDSVGILTSNGNSMRHLYNDSTESIINMKVLSTILTTSERHNKTTQERRSSHGGISGISTTVNGHILDHSDNENMEIDILPTDDDQQIPRKRKRTLSIENGKEERSGMDPIAQFLTELEHHSPDKIQRIHTLQTLIDKFAIKPIRTIKIMNGAKEHLYGWFSYEVDAIADNTASPEFLLILMDVLDHALWKVSDMVQIRMDKTLRKLYKTCAALDNPTMTIKFEPIMKRSKELWPKYRQLYKSSETDEGGITVDK